MIESARTYAFTIWDMVLLALVMFAINYLTGAAWSNEQFFGLVAVKALINANRLLIRSRSS